MDSSPEDRLDDILAEIGLGLFPAGVQAEVEKLLTTGQSLEPGARDRFVKAAKRGARRVALTHAALEVLLFDERRERDQEAEDLAGVIHIDANDIRAIERGERPINSQGPDQIAAWARHLAVDRDVLDRGLRKSLGTPVGAPAYAGEREPCLTTEEDDFVRDVLSAFDGTADENS